MKKYLFILILFLVSYQTFSQKGISYQAVIIDPAKVEIPGQDISRQPLFIGNVWLKFQIYSGTSLQFEEVQTTKTDEYGLVNLLIGSVASSSFNSLIWDATQKSMQVYVSFNQGVSYTKVSDQNLTYVPYSLYAETAAKFSGILPISAGGTGATTAKYARTNLDLDKVDNTSDANKPISNAVQIALNLKANSADVMASLEAKVDTGQIKSYVDSKLNTMNAGSSGSISDADTITKGKIQLAGDLAGTASAPSVPGLALKANASDVTASLALKASLTSLNTEVTRATAAELVLTNGINFNTLSITSITSSIEANTASITANSVAINLKSPIESPSLTGVPSAPTALIGTNSTQLATTAFVANAVSNINVGSISGTISVANGGTGLVSAGSNGQVLTSTASGTLTWTTPALGGGTTSDADAITKGKIQLAGDLGGTASAPTVRGLALKANALDVTASLALKASAVSLTDEITRATAAELVLTNGINSNTSSITTNTADILLRATSASPSLTGTPTAPTAIAGTNTNQLATTAFVTTALAGSSGASDATSGVKGILKLTNDLGGTANLPTVNSVGGVSSSTITAVASLVNSATSNNTPNTLVKRDGSGGFSTGTITGTLSGTASNANALTIGRTISSTGDVSYTSAAFDGTGNVSGVATLANSGVVSGTYGTSTSIPTFTVDSKGRITNTNTINIPSATSSLTGLLTGADYATFNAKQVALTAGSGISISSGTIIASGITSSNLSNTAGITNGQLANSAIKLGSTSMSLGGTYTSVTGLSSVTSTNFTGTLSGTASGLTTGRTISSTGDVAYTSGSFSGTTNVTGAATVNFVGGVSSSNIATVASLVNDATSSNMPNTIVKRDVSGGFRAGSINSTSVNTGTLIVGPITYPTDAGSPGFFLKTDGDRTASWAAVSEINHYVGEPYGGGIVYFVYDNGKHGLIVSSKDLGESIHWGNGEGENSIPTFARADGIGAGIKNTTIIIANQRQFIKGPTAASVCNEYSVMLDPEDINGLIYGDWYLPSKSELNLLFLQIQEYEKLKEQLLMNSIYWSSTEDSTDDLKELIGTKAWAIDFRDEAKEVQLSSDKLNKEIFVRAIRAF